MTQAFAMIVDGMWPDWTLENKLEVIAVVVWESIIVLLEYS